jgi:WD40 repeat protein
VANPDRTQTIAPRSPSSAAPGDVALAPTVDDESRDETAAAGSDRRTPSWRDEGAAPVSLPIDDPDRYELAGEHARGGLGRVVRAVDRRLGRTVAVKELLKQSTLAESLFVREALITARLQHPGIVPVHEAGRWPNGEPYYVMRLVQGRTLKELVAEARTTRDRLALLSHVIAVADAIGYAHSEQVIHRDIKPSNVVVGPHGETVVVDWGLARDGRREVPEIDADAVAAGAGSGSCETTPAVGRTSTVSGKVIGTPAYMAPEQARGGTVDERADVYAIGAVLYELLAGEAPYNGDTPQAVLERVTGGPPKPLAQVAPTLPPDLVAIVDKAMSRSANDRYDTAKELAADLRRFANGQLVTARTYGTFQLLRRWVSRHRGVVAVAAIAVLALLLSGIGFVRRIVEERNLAQMERERAIGAAAAAESRQAELVRLQAHSSLRRDPTAAVAWIKAYPRTAPHQDEIAGLLDEALAYGVARHVFRQTGFVQTVEFSPDGKWVTTSSMDRKVRLYDVENGTVRVLGEQPTAYYGVLFTKDGAGVVTAAEDGGVRLWPIAGGAPRILVAPDDETRLRQIAMSSDGRSLLVKHKDKGVIVALDQPDGKITEVKAPPDTHVVVARDDWRKSIAMASDGVMRDIDGNVLGRLPGRPSTFGITHDGSTWFAHVDGAIWSGARGGTPVKLAAFDESTERIHISEDDRFVAVMGESHDIFVYDRKARRPHVMRGHADSVYACVFTPDGRRLISASDDGTARVWDLATGESVVLRGHDDDVWDVALSPSGDVVATASLDGSIRIWSIGGGAGMGPDPARVLGITVVGDRAIAVGPAFASSYDLKTGERTPLYDGDPSTMVWHSSIDIPVNPVSLDGNTIAGFNGNVVAVRGPGDAQPRLLEGHRDLVTRIQMTPDGRTIYSASRDGSVRQWDVATGVGKEIFAGKKGKGIYSLAVADDGRIAFRADDTMYLIPRAGEPAQKLGSGNAWCTSSHPLSFDELGRLVLSRCDTSIAVWTEKGGLRELVKASNPANQAIDLALSPDRTKLAGAMNDRTVKVWDAMTGREIVELRGHVDLVLDVEWSPDGRLASSSYDRTIRIWNIETRASKVLRGHSRAVEIVRWIDGGTRLISGSRDGVLRLWQAPPMTAPSPDEVRTALHRVTTVRIGDDDRPTTNTDQSK